MTTEKSARLREIRVKLDLSPVLFGVAMGFDHASAQEIAARVERYENGCKEPPETIMRLAEMLLAHGIPKEFWSDDYPDDAAKQFHDIIKDLDLSMIDMAIVLGFQGTDKTVSSQIRRYADGSREIPPWTLRLAIMLDRFGVPDEYLDDSRKRI